MRRSFLAAVALMGAAVLTAISVSLRAESPVTEAVTPRPAALAAGDPVRGRIVFGACRTCHYPDKGAGHQNGPSLWAIFGRRAGTQEGFAYYSEALRNSGLVWTPEYLDAWLANPEGFIRGTSMMSLGVPDPQRRADLIAYLMQFRE